MFCLPLGGCRASRANASLEPVRRSQPLLGTFVTITVYGPDRGRLNEAVSAAFETFHEADALMSVHRPDSQISRVNREGALHPVRVAPGLFSVLEHAGRIASESGGAFDVTIGPLTRLWGFIWKEYRLPTDSELARVKPLVDFNLLRLDAASATVELARPGMMVDLGGIGKGVAVDWAIARLRSFGVTNAMVRAGGDLRVMGTPPGREAWDVQIEDPGKEGRRVAIRLRDAALSTSGSYENYFMINGRRYSHILDPRSGLPVQGIASCTLIAPTCAESDAWATACFVYGVESSLQEFGDRFPMRFVLETEPGEAPRIRETESFPKAAGTGAGRF